VLRKLRDLVLQTAVKIFVVILYKTLGQVQSWIDVRQGV